MSWLSDWYDTAKTRVKQYANSTFRDGVLGTSALIAAADGSVDPKERTKVANLIAKNELLQVFDGTALKTIFEGYCDKAADEFSRLDVLNVVRKLKADPAAAETALKIGLIIANADGTFDENEKKVVREIAGVLGLKAEEYLAA